MIDLDMESYKFKAESLKQFGFVLCTPLSLVILKAIISEICFMKFIMSIEALFAFTFFIFGFIMINRSVDILEKRKNNYD